MQAGRELSHILHSSDYVFQRRFGFQAPRSAINSIEGKGSSIMFRGARQKFDQAELASFPLSRDELVRCGYEAEHVGLQVR